MRTAVLILPAFIGMALIAPDALANDQGFERRVVLAAGGGYPASGGVFLAARFRYLPQTPFALEFNLYAPYGFGAAVLLDVYRGERLRVHAFDLGFFEDLPWLKVSHPEVGRFYDLTLGCGIEWRVADNHVVSVDWRAFLPEPSSVPFKYGNYSLKFYRDALIGGQIWLGYIFDLDQ